MYQAPLTIGPTTPILQPVGIILFDLPFLDKTHIFQTQ